jgi:hypothetical protein
VAESGGGGEGRGLLDYPVDYTFKVMGLAGDDFAVHAERLVAAVVAEVLAARTVVRHSRNGKYQSVSVVARLRSEGQRRAVYEALRSDGRVVYYL